MWLRSACVVDVDGVRGCNIENVGLILVLVEFRFWAVFCVLAIVLGDSTNMTPFLYLLVLVSRGGSLGIAVNVVVTEILAGRKDECVISFDDSFCSCVPVVFEICTAGGGFFVSSLDPVDNSCLDRRELSFVRVVSGGLDKQLFGISDLVSIVTFALAVACPESAGGGCDVPVLALVEVGNIVIC
jgi:hypothetical protein